MPYAFIMLTLREQNERFNSLYTFEVGQFACRQCNKRNMSDADRGTEEAKEATSNKFRFRTSNGFDSTRNDNCN